MKLDHIGIAVKDLDQAKKFYGEILGFPISEPEELPDRQLKLIMVDVGGANVELLVPTHPDSAIAKFLDKRGPGIHHICYRVDDVNEKLEKLKAAGMQLIDQQARPGAHNTLVAFIHPSSVGGVLTEICQDAG